MINRWIYAIGIYIAGIGTAEIILTLISRGSDIPDTGRYILYVLLFVLIVLACILTNNNYNNADN